MASKIRIKMGAVEVEYEGSDDFLRKELPDLLSAVSKLHRETAGLSTSDRETPSDSGQKKIRTATDKIHGTTATIAGKLKCRPGNGKELIIAAATHLTFVKGEDSFNRQRLLDEAKGASGYYKSSISANLSNTLSKLVKDGHLVESSKDVYALSADKRSGLETSLAS